MVKTRRKLNDILDSRPFLSTVVLAVVLTLVTELLNRRSAAGLFQFIAQRPLAFLANFAIILLTLAVALFFRRRIFVLSLVCVIWICFGLTDFFTLIFRGTPFSARDFALIVSFLEVADVYFKVWQMILMALFVAGLVFAFIVIFRKAPKCRALAPVRSVLGFAAALCIAAGGCVYMQLTYDLNADFLFINDAYDTCGFPYCFSCSIFQNGIACPDEYSEEEVEDILETIDPEPDGLLPNIIFVQLESFIDPKGIKDAVFEEDPVPNFTKLKEDCPSGYLTVPTIGGATVNTEFEVLTGMNIDYFGIGEYPYESILKETTCESIPYILDSLTSHAIHDHNGSFYDRNVVYSNLGFDTFTALEYMNDVPINPSGWAEDSILTGCISDCLTSTEGRDFIFTVTVQAHGRYPDDDDPDSVETENDYPGFDYYVNQLSGTDAFIGDLLEYLKSYPEPVVAVFYGDHLPSIGLEPEDLESGTLYETEYAIWYNRGALKAADRDIETYRLSSLVFDVTSIGGGILPEYHRAYYGTEEYAEGLELLQYDMLYGERAAYEGDVPQPTELRMGLHDIKISSAEKSSGKIFVYGENFTPYSVIYIDGHRRGTEFIDSGCIATKAGARPGDLITVAQLANDRVLLSETEPYIFG